MAIRFTKRAERSIERIDDWWRVDRRASPDLFWQELNAGIDRDQDVFILVVWGATREHGPKL